MAEPKFGDLEVVFAPNSVVYAEKEARDAMTAAEAYAKACHDALAIFSGATNPNGVTKTMVEIASACSRKAGTVDMKSPEWAPYRLCLTQMAHCAGVTILEWLEDEAYCQKAIKDWNGSKPKA